MSLKESKIKIIIREYLLDEGLLRKKIDDPKLEFGFQFSFPPGPRGNIMAVFKPRSKDLMIISLGTQVSESHVKALEDKKIQYFIELRKSFLLKNVFFRIDIQNNRYEISDQIFLKGNNVISKNSFFKSIRKVFNTAAYSNIILGEFCAGKISPEDLDKTKDFSSDNDYTLYS